MSLNCYCTALSKMGEKWNILKFGDTNPQYVAIQTTDYIEVHNCHNQLQEDTALELIVYAASYVVVQHIPKFLYT